MNRIAINACSIVSIVVLKVSFPQSLDIDTAADVQEPSYRACRETRTKLLCQPSIAPTAAL